MLSQISPTRRRRSLMLRLRISSTCILMTFPIFILLSDLSKAWVRRPNGLPLSRERRASQRTVGEINARRSSVCSGVILAFTRSKRTPRALFLFRVNAVTAPRTSRTNRTMPT